MRGARFRSSGGFAFAALLVAAVASSACGVLLIGGDDDDDDNKTTSSPPSGGGGDGSTDGSENGLNQGDGGVPLDASDDTDADGGTTTSKIPCPKCASGYCPTGPCDPLAFVTDEDWNGSFEEVEDAGGIEKLDVACRRSAEKAGVPGNYKAWASEDAPVGIEPDRLIQTPRPYRRRDGEIVVPNFDGFKRATGLDHPLTVTAAGNTLTNTAVWTGTTYDWSKPTVTQDTRDCAGWTNNLSTGESGLTGLTACANGDVCSPDHWTFRDTHQCNQRAHVYCLEQVP